MKVLQGTHFTRRLSNGLIFSVVLALLNGFVGGLIGVPGLATSVAFAQANASADLSALSVEYAQLAAIYTDLLRDPPTYAKADIQSIVTTVNGLVAAMPIAVLHEGVPIRVHGARLALRTASAMAHRHSYCQDARDISVAARQAYVDWAGQDSTKQDLVTAVTNTIDTQGVGLMAQTDGDYPPPPPSPPPPGTTVVYEIAVVNKLGGWNVSYQLGSTRNSANSISNNWTASLTAEPPIHIEVYVTSRNGDPTDHIELEIRMDQNPVATNALGGPAISQPILVGDW